MSSKRSSHSVTFCVCVTKVTDDISPARDSPLLITCKVISERQPFLSKVSIIRKYIIITVSSREMGKYE